jgi:DNA-directed RNA polymerase subunit RPC12/RpoP
MDGKKIKEEKMSRYCAKCKKEMYDERIEVFTYFGEAYYTCDDCSFDVMNFIEDKK